MAYIYHKHFVNVHKGLPIYEKNFWKTFIILVMNNLNKSSNFYQ